MPPRRAASAFLPKSSDWQQLSAQVDLAGHRNVLAHGDATNGGDDRHGHRDAGGWAVFRHRTGGHVQVDRVLVEEVVVYFQPVDDGAGVGDRSDSRLLHDIAELSGENQIVLARHDGDLYREQVSTDTRDGRAGGDADFVGFAGQPVFIARDAEQLFDIILRLDGRYVGRTGRDGTSHLACDRTDLPFQIADSCFIRVFANERTAVLPRRSRAGLRSGRATRLTWGSGIRARSRSCQPRCSSGLR